VDDNESNNVFNKIQRIETELISFFDCRSIKLSFMKRYFVLFVSMMVGIASGYAQSKVGNNPTSINATAVFEVESTTKGFLPPRMTTAQRNAIPNKVNGLVIYNTDVKCMQWFQSPNWFDGCSGAQPPIGGDFSNGFQNNTTCSSKVISKTSCAAVTGATLNDDVTTTEGFEYDWTSASTYMTGGNTRALVEIGGQCWFRRNSISAPVAPCTSAINTGCNVWLNTSPGDIGAWGYYNTVTTNGSAGWGTTEPAAGEGLFYQWSAAMNGTTTERNKGVCPTGWHIPSDCEWMYLEHALGMGIAQQTSLFWRTTTGEGNKLRSVGGSWNNASGFTALNAGYRFTNGGFTSRGTITNVWSSSEVSGSSATSRSLNSSQAGVYRSGNSKDAGFSVRCLKD